MPCGTPAGPRHGRGWTTSRSASTPAPAGPTSCCPTATCSPSASSASRSVTGPRVRPLGLRREERSRARHRGRCSSGASGTGKTLAAEVLANDLRLDLYRIDLSRSSASTSARPRRTCGGSSTPPRTAARCCSSTRPTRCSASAARSRTATTATPTSRSATSSSGWRRTAGSRSWRPTSRRVSTRRSCAGSDSRSPFPFPVQAARVEIWRRAFPAAAPTNGLDAERLACLERGRRQHPEHRRQRRLPGGRQRRPDRDQPCCFGRQGRSTRSSSDLTDAEAAGWA